MTYRSLALFSLILVCSWLIFSTEGLSDSFTMKGPKEKTAYPSGSQQIETSSVTIAFLGVSNFIRRELHLSGELSAGSGLPVPIMLQVVSRSKDLSSAS